MTSKHSAVYRRHLLLAVMISAGALLPCAAFEVSSAFENGSAKVLSLNPETQQIHISPAGDLNRGMPNWWYLRIDGIDTNKPVTLDVTALDVTIPLETGKTSVLNPGWTLPTRAAISTNGTNWQQTSPGERDGNHSVYRVTTSSPTVWLAWGPPFTPGDASRFIEQIARGHAFAKAFTLAESLEGRPVPAVRISEGAKPPAQRPAVWVLGRQHAWEVGGSWVGIGFAEWLAGDDESAKWLRQNAEIVFVPLMDVDHVATGDGGKHARPHDQNRDWSDAPHWPEVAAAQKGILSAAKDGRMAVFLDVHNPSATSNLPMFYRDFPPYIGEKASAIEDQFLAVAQNVFGEIKVIDGKPSTPEALPVWHHLSTSWVLEHGNPQTISFTVEIPWNTPEGTPEGYREVGRKLGLAVEHHLVANKVSPVNR